MFKYMCLCVSACSNRYVHCELSIYMFGYMCTFHTSVWSDGLADYLVLSLAGTVWFVLQDYL